MFLNAECREWLTAPFAYATSVALSCICALVWGTWIELHNDNSGCSWLSFFSKIALTLCIKEALLHRFCLFFIPFIKRKVTTNSADLNLLPYSFNLLRPSNNHSPPRHKRPPFSTSKMQFSIFTAFLSLLALSHTAPVPQGDVDPVNIVSNSDSPFAVGVAGDANSENGFGNGDPIVLKPRDEDPTNIVSNDNSPFAVGVAGDANAENGFDNGDPTAMFPSTMIPRTNPVNVVSNSLSPLSGNNAGNSNSDTGLLNGADITAKRDAQSSSPANVISNSLSPLSGNAAGNDDKNTGTANGNTVTVAPQVDPTVNV